MIIMLAPQPPKSLAYDFFRFVSWPQFGSRFQITLRGLYNPFSEATPYGPKKNESLSYPIADLQPAEVVVAEKIDRISRLPLAEAEQLVASIRAKGARLAVPVGSRTSLLDQLRTGPVMVSSLSLVQAVRRLHSVRELGIPGCLQWGKSPLCKIRGQRVQTGTPKREFCEICEGMEG
jgi:hypothetical protein